ncbi:accessory gene regulator B family protein [Paenibacillus sp.]|uniref:accessory gene regulator ArgB-like protein n=1 Tax=Paenibacillus sp. TaxID=58172 RepID=UPI0028A625F9|nr:accessory gene regulator B family protein [Paenibacillus sp.]
MTMNHLAFRIVSAIKKTNPEQTHSIEVMQYALSIILNTLFIITVSLLIGGFTGQLMGTLIALLSFGLLRMCSGGAHLKTARACNITSIFICSLIPHLTSLSHSYLIWINLFSLISMVLFAPNPDRNAQLSKDWYLGLKLLSIMLVLSNFWINSSVIGLAFFIQSLTVIIPLQGRFSR